MARPLKLRSLHDTRGGSLQVQSDRQGFERQALGDAYADNGLVFATQLGAPLNRDNVTKRLKRVLQTAGIPSSRPFHTLRHDNATLALFARVNAKTTADRLQAALTQVRRKATGAS